MRTRSPYRPGVCRDLAHTDPEHETQGDAMRCEASRHATSLPTCKPGRASQPRGSRKADAQKGNRGGDNPESADPETLRTDMVALSTDAAGRSGAIIDRVGEEQHSGELARHVPDDGNEHDRMFSGEVTQMPQRTNRRRTGRQPAPQAAFGVTPRGHARGKTLPAPRTSRSPKRPGRRSRTRGTTGRTSRRTTTHDPTTSPFRRDRRADTPQGDDRSAARHGQTRHPNPTIPHRPPANPRSQEQETRKEKTQEGKEEG